MNVNPISPEKLLDTIQRLGVLDFLKSKLVKQPDVAAAKLATVLDELSKIYGSMNEELGIYLSLFFDDLDPEQLKREKTSLASLDEAEILIRMSEARGRCKKIYNIYKRYLRPWFDQILLPEERKDLNGLFRELSDIDSHMVDAINDIATWLAKEANETKDLVKRGDFESANKRIIEARRVIHPQRERIVEAMLQIRRLEGNFIEISGAV
jgi:hypothetical protein